MNCDKLPIEDFFGRLAVKMLDWFNIAGNALWIIGLALALATISYASWEAWLYRENLAARLTVNKQAMLYLAGLLFCCGLGATSNTTWEVVFWVVLGVILVIQLVRTVLPSQRS
jgi:hypothetical protein